ncbi:pyrroline-5-carboxylate reductase-like [Rutidosis leptorrhynchoides]|uniref:pyrroline-5-carboxylate reductase-like n=1 Tax=Rutidosis leptorrhynchoides TaxID=125765 RepID=UPI003A98E670
MEALAPISMDTFKLGFIGAGKMAESVAKGVIQSGVLPPNRISTSHSDPDRWSQLQSLGLKLLPNNDSVVEDSDVVVFSVKPQVVKEAVSKLRPLLSKKKLLVSVAAGVRLKDLEEWAGHGRFIRVMPNTPAAVGKAASVMSLGSAATEEDGELIAKLFGSIGKIWKANDKLFDAVTGVSGSGPAYIFLAIEALADGGVAAGLPRDLALGLASQTVLGAAAMVTKSGKHPGQLKDDVASPGGTTIAGIHELEKGGFRATIMNAVVAAAKRGQELSQANSSIATHEWKMVRVSRRNIILESSARNIDKEIRNCMSELLQFDVFDHHVILWSRHHSNKWQWHVDMEGIDSIKWFDSTRSQPSFDHVFEFRRKIEGVQSLFRGIESSKGCYDPLLVSIGPYHYKKPEFTEGSRIKIKMTNQFVQDSGRPIKDMYDKMVQEIEDASREYYPRAA